MDKDIECLNKNEVYKLYINDHLFIDVVYDGKNLIIDSYGNTPEDTISIVSTTRKAIIGLAGIPVGTIDLDTGKLHTRKKIIPTSMVRNYSEIINTEAEDGIYLHNQFLYSREVENNTEQNETDLHTHFMEVLSGEEFLQLVLNHLDYLGLNSKGLLCGAYPSDNDNPKLLNISAVDTWISKEEILSNRELYNNLASQLSLPAEKQVQFDEINVILNRRTALINLYGYNKSIEEIDSLAIDDRKILAEEIKKIISDAKAEIYVEILLKSLTSLKEQKIKYVELSYSTTSTIKKMYKEMKDSEVDGIKFGFLLSENRNSGGKRFKDCNGDLRQLIKSGYVVGFDLMGAEQLITSDDYLKNSKGNSSLYDKLSPIIKTLNSFNDNNLVLRLHAGEIKYYLPNTDEKSNPEKILEIIDMIVKDNGLIVPPPTIRIGHGLNIEKNDRYLDLLRRYGVIIEINSSSNFALGMVKDMSDIPYRWYYENKIPMVLGTDGGGFYLSTIQDESKNASVFGGIDVVEWIRESEQNYLKRRGS